MSKSRKEQEIKRKSNEIPGDQKSVNKLKNSLGIIIAIFAFILYAQSISFDYAYDDGPMIKENKYTVLGFKGIPDILTKDYWAGWSKNSRTPEYRPTSLIMFATEWALFPDNPHVGHLINIHLYTLSCWILYLLLCKLFEKRNLIFPFIIAILFAAHPIHTEVVDNIKSRDEILCFLFFLLSANLLFNYIKTNSVKTLILALLSFTVCVFSKESGITYLVIIPLMLFVFSSSDYKKIFKISLLLAIPAVIYLVIRSQVLQSVPVNSSGELPNTTFIVAPDFISREATAFFILIRYISLLIIPHPLTYDYGFAEITVHAISDPVVLLSILVYSVLGIYAIITIRKKNILAFAILFYLITLSPVSNLFILIGSSITMAERFMYAPSLGFCIIITILLARLTKAELFKSRFNSIKTMAAANSNLFTIVLVVICLYSIKTFARTMDWKDNLTLFGHDAKTSDKSSKAHGVYGYTLLIDEYPKEKNKQKQMAILDSSIVELNTAAKIYPKFAAYYRFLGTAYEFKNDYPNTIKNFELNIQYSPTPPLDVMKKLGSLYVITKQYDNAITILDTVLNHKPDEVSYVNSGTAYFNKGKYQDAITAFDKAIELNPKLTAAYQNAGAANINLKQYPEALKYLNKAEMLDSNDVNNINNLVLVYRQIGDKDKTKEYQEKIRILKAKK